MPFDARQLLICLVVPPKRTYSTIKILRFGAGGNGGMVLPYTSAICSSVEKKECNPIFVSHLLNHSGKLCNPLKPAYEPALYQMLLVLRLN